MALASVRDDVVDWPLASALRRICWRTIRESLARAPESARRNAARLPFSRYHGLLGLVHGPELVRWKSVRLEVDPGEIEGSLLDFLGGSVTCSDAELDAIRALCKGERTLLFDVGASVGAVSLAMASACPDRSLSAAIHGGLTSRGYPVREFARVPCRPPEEWPSRIHIVAER